MTESAHTDGVETTEAALRRTAGELVRLTEEAERWLVPPEHRPTCPVDGEPCKSWTCLVDVCVGKRKAVDSVPSAYAEGYEAGYQQSVKDNA